MDVSATGLAAAVRALEDVVAPALDPDDPPAREQLTLVVDYLRFVRERMPHLHTKARWDLGQRLELARSLLVEADLPRAPAAELAELVGPAERTHEDPSVPMAQLHGSTEALGAAIRELIRSTPTLHAELRCRVERAVLRSERAAIELERAWFAPFGFENDRDAARPVEELLIQEDTAAPAAPARGDVEGAR